MEPNFQTSFIPKKPMLNEEVRHSSRSVSLLALIAFFIFFTMLIATGGLYLYKGALAKGIEKMKGELAAAKNRFEPSRIENLQKLDERLRVADQVLSRHIAASPIFKALGEITMKSVRYTQFAYALDDKSSRINVKLEGLATGYRAIALQSDLFAKNKNLIDPVFSNLSLDDRGNVTFALEFSVDPSFVSYREVLKRESVPPGLPVF